MSVDLNILKAISTNKNLAKDFVYECDANVFSTEYFSFAQALLKYISTNKDVPTLRVLEEKNKKNQKLCETIRNTWNKLDSFEYNEKEFKYDLDKIKERYAESRLNKLRDELNSSDSLLNNLSTVKNTISDINKLKKKKAFDKKSLKDAISLFTEKYNAKLEARKAGKEINFSTKTNYSALDEYTGGIQDGEFLLICGESNSGKSMYLLNLSIQMWMQNNTIDSTEFSEGNHVLYFSLEMPLEACFNRVLARLANVESKKIRDAKLNKDEQARVKKALDFIKNYPYQFQIVDAPRGVNISVIENIYEETKSDFDPKVVAIDYLGLMDYEGGDMQDWLKLGYISEEVHEFGRVHNVIMLSAVQLNRMNPAKDVEEKIGMHRIGRSSLIVMNANIAIQIHTRQNEQQYPDMEYFIIKNREGALGKGTLIKNLACGSLLDNKIEYQESFIDASDLSGYMEDLELF